MKKIQKHHQGVVILEVLVSIVIFAVGVLGIVGLQAVTAKAGIDARFRTEAATLSDEIVARAQIWTDSATLASNFTGTSDLTSRSGGSEFVYWYDNRLKLTGSGLPGAIAIVTFPATYTVTGAGKLITVQVSWQAPGVAERSAHTTVAALPGTGG